MNTQHLDLLTKACDEIVAAKEAIANAESKIAYIREQIQQITATPAQSETKITKFSDFPQPRASRVKEILESGKKVTNDGGVRKFEETPSEDISKFAHTPKNLRDITISSLEIAELTGKQHLHIMRDIRDILGELGDVSKFGYIYKDTYGREQKCYRLPKREALILVSGYNVKLRAKIIDRLEYLENQMLDKILSQTPQQQQSIDESLKRYEALFGGKFSVQTPCKQFIMQNIAQAEAKHNAIATELVSYNYTEEFKKGKAKISSKIGLVYDRPVPIDKKPIITKGYLPSEMLRENQSSITANAESNTKVRKR